MSKKIKIIDRKENSKVITFRLGESLYSEFEKQTQETGGTVSGNIRKLILDNLQDRELQFKPGDTLRYQDTERSTDCIVFLVDGALSGSELKKRINKLVKGSPTKEAI